MGRTLVGFIHPPTFGFKFLQHLLLFRFQLRLLKLRLIPIRSIHLERINLLLNGVNLLNTCFQVVFLLVMLLFELIERRLDCVNAFFVSINEISLRFSSAIVCLCNSFSWLKAAICRSTACWKSFAKVSNCRVLSANRGEFMCE